MRQRLLFSGFVALNADGNSLRVVVFVALSHLVGFVGCRLDGVLALFHAGRVPVDRYLHRLSRRDRIGSDQTDLCLAVEQELSVGRTGAHRALVLDRRRERYLTALGRLIITRR